MKMTKFFVVFLLFIISISSSLAVADVALVDGEAVLDANAYSAFDLKFKVKNVGDEPAVARLRVQLFTPAQRDGVGTYDLLRTDSNQFVESVVVVAADGSERVEVVEERKLMYSYTDAQGKDGTGIFSPQPTIILNPGEFVEVERDFHFRDKYILSPGEKKVGVRLFGYDATETNLVNHELLIDVVVNKREPLVEVGPLAASEYHPQLDENQYFIHDYEEYKEAGVLCTDIAQQEVCVLGMENFDGEHYPFTVNGNEQKLSFMGKLLLKFNQDSFVYNVLDDFVKVEMDGIRIYLTGAPGWLVEDVS